MKLKDLLDVKKIDPTELAEKIGVDRTIFPHIWAGRTRVSLNLAAKIATATKTVAVVVNGEFQFFTPAAQTGQLNKIASGKGPARAGRPERERSPGRTRGTSDAPDSTGIRDSGDGGVRGQCARHGGGAAGRAAQTADAGGTAGRDRSCSAGG